MWTKLNPVQKHKVIEFDEMMQKKLGETEISLERLIKRTYSIEDLSENDKKLIKNVTGRSIETLFD